MPTAGSTPCGRTSTPRRSGNDLRLRTTERTKLRRRASVLIDRGNEVGVVVDVAETKTKTRPKLPSISHACRALSFSLSNHSRVSFITPSGARSAMATVAWTARVRTPGPSRRRDLRARASRSRVGGEGDARRRAADDGVDDATSTAPMTRRDACAALAFAASSAVAGAARADTAAISRAYDGYAASYDDLDGGAFAADTLGLDATRRALLAKARGDVLELGVGTGLNLPGYDATRVTSLTAVDISRGMLEKAEARARTQGLFVDAREKRGDLRRRRRRAPAVSGRVVRLRGGHVFAVRFRRPRGGAPGGATRAEARRYGAARRAHQVQNSASAGRVPGPRRRAGDENEQGCAWNQDVVAMATRAGLRVTSAEPGLAGLLTTLEATVAEGSEGAGVSTR